MLRFHERLKELRAEKNLSQMQLSKLTGLSAGAIGFWETGKRIPNALAIITLAKYFGVTTDFLLKGSQAQAALHKELNVIIERLVELERTL